MIRMFTPNQLDTSLDLILKQSVDVENKFVHVGLKITFFFLMDLKAITYMIPQDCEDELKRFNDMLI